MISKKPDIITILSNEGIDVKRGWARCPLHVERHPSFKVDTHCQRFRCFGCGEKGDVIDLVMKLHGLTFPEALGHLGMDGSRPKVNRREQRKRELLRDFRKWERRRLTELSHAMRQCRGIIDLGGPERLHVTAHFIEEMADAELQIEVLQHGSDAGKYSLWRDQNGKRL